MTPSEPGKPSSAIGVFGSTVSTVLTLAGVAIGLGNVWRFPYMMGSYGGSAFFLLFLLMMLVIAVPALMAELSLARVYRGATIRVLRLSFGGFGKFLGYLLVAGVGIAASYYLFVVANVFYSAGFSLFVGFSEEALPAYESGLATPWLQYIIGLTVLWTAILVIAAGLRAGVERISKLFVPFFFLVCLYLVFFTLSQPGAIDASLHFLKPDFSVIGFTEIFAVLGQCFFSAGLGAAYIMVYGKFLREDANIGQIARFTALSDLGASLLASLFIVPCVLLFALPLDAGPQLLFDTLPNLFVLMGGARFSASLFLVALSLIALLSVIASFNVITFSVEEEPAGQRWGRRRLLLAIGAIETVMLIPPTWHPELIGPLDLVFGSGTPVLGCLFAVLAITWRVKRHDALKHMFASATPGTASRLLFAWVQWVIPFALASILIGTVYSALV